MIQDNYGRTVSYLRLSITDRCNLNCFYCRPCKNTRFLPHKDIVTYEDIFYLLEAVSEMDVHKVRLTGGEPFVRRGVMNFLSSVKDKFPMLDIHVTTNATLIGDKVRLLSVMGIKKLNISLDSLDREKYQQITGQDALVQVLRTINNCLERGIRVKVNVVALRGVNDEEIGSFVKMALDKPLEVRFIEFMPIGQKTIWNKNYFWPAEEIIRAVQNITQLEPVADTERNHGPARIFNLPQGKGRLGFISPLSNHFCGTCNRLRITADGRLRTCLFSDRDFRLLPLIRSPRIGLQKLKLVLARAGYKKPMGHQFIKSEAPETSICKRVMSSIGG